MPSGWVPPLLRGMGVLLVGFVALTFHTSQTSPFQPVTVTRRHAASSEVHLRSPVRCFPSPVASFGSKLPWTLPLAFHPTVTSDAERDWEQAFGHSPEGFRLTQLVRPRVAPQKSSAYLTTARLLSSSPRFRCFTPRASSMPCSAILASKGLITPP